MHDIQVTGELDASDVRKEVRIDAVTTGHLFVRVVHVTVSQADIVSVSVSSARTIINGRSRPKQSRNVTVTLFMLPTIYIEYE